MRNSGRFLVMLVLCACGSCGCRMSGGSSSGTSQVAASSDHHVGQRDLGGYIARMESSDRAEWQKPEQVIAALELRLGERVADLGCGPGYLTLPLAEAVGPTGKVWAVDIEPAMLARLREHIQDGKIENIQTVHCSEDDPALPAGQVDTIFIVNTYHHFSYRPVYVSKLKRALAPDGRIVIIDFVPKSREERGFGPRLEMQLSRSTVDAELATSGFYPAAEHGFLPEQYFVEYRLKQ